MPPKRKQVDESAAPEASTSTRSTRASTRSSTAKNTASSKATSTKKATTAKGAAAKNVTASSTPSANGEGDVNASDGLESVRPSKKTKTTDSSKTRKSTAKAPASRAENDDEPTRKSSFTKELPSDNGYNTEHPSAEKHKPPATPKKANKPEPYSAQRALKLFEKYADSEDTSVIGPDGFVQLCTDADMPMEGALPIILAWQFNAKEMAKISKKEWVTGTSALQISSISQISTAVKDLEDLLIHGKPPLQPTSKKDSQEYNRTIYFGYAANVKAAFQKLYSFSFNLVKPEGSKNIEMETSVAFWTVLLVPKYPLMGEVVRFINEKGTYKATNKDLWSMMLEFCQTVSPTLEDYEADGAWPTLLDDFVAWKSIQSSKAT